MSAFIKLTTKAGGDLFILRERIVAFGESSTRTEIWVSGDAEPFVVANTPGEIAALLEASPSILDDALARLQAVHPEQLQAIRQMVKKPYVDCGCPPTSACMKPGCPRVSGSFVQLPGQYPYDATGINTPC